MKIRLNGGDFLVIELSGMSDLSFKLQYYENVEEKGFYIHSNKLGTIFEKTWKDKDEDN
jgi:hypothetical protein